MHIVRFHSKTSIPQSNGRGIIIHEERTTLCFYYRTVSGKKISSPGVRTQSAIGMYKASKLVRGVASGVLDPSTK